MPKNEEFKHLEPNKVLDKALFYNGNRVQKDLMRHLYRMGYTVEEASKIFDSWLTKRKYRVVEILVVKT